MGTATLGSTTSTQDKEGEVLESHPVPVFSREQIDAAVNTMRGDFYQLPPMVSAIKMGGVPLYKLARKGQVVEREPRLVHVFESEINRLELPEIDFRIVCSKGFYVRTYAHDLGQQLGCGAHLSALRRSRSGSFTFQPGKFATYDMLKQGRREEVLDAMYSLYDVSKLRGV